MGIWLMSKKPSPPAKQVRPAMTAMTGHKGPHNRRKLKVVWFLILGGLGLLSIPSAIIFVIGSLPLVSIWNYDRSPQKTTGICVALTNMAGMVPFLVETLGHGHSMSSSSPIMERGTTWLVIYVSAALGWLVVLIFPKIVRNILAMHLAKKMDQIKQKQEELVNEWGDKIRNKPVL
jgi:predicted membrane channel-forming protein YqfA (hemolysin III family)